MGGDRQALRTSFSMSTIVLSELTKSTGKSHQLHGLGRPREVSSNNSLRSSKQRAELLPLDGRSKQWFSRHEQVRLTPHRPACTHITNEVSSREHLGIALALNVPVLVVITKIDICPPQILEQTITQLTKILKSPGARKIPVFIKNREECINTAVSKRNCNT